MFTSSLAPDFKSGLTFASFQELGNSPDIMLLLTMNVRLGVKILADNLRIFGPILSNPVDLFTFKSVRKVLTNVSFVKEIQNSECFGTFDWT